MIVGFVFRECEQIRRRLSRLHFSFAGPAFFLSSCLLSRLQAKLGAHRAMLCHFLSLLSSSLGKQQLKTGLSLEEVAAATRSAYLASPEDRLGKARQPIGRELTRLPYVLAPPTLSIVFLLLQYVMLVWDSPSENGCWDTHRRIKRMSNESEP